MTTSTASPAEINRPGMITGLRPTLSEISPSTGPNMMPRPMYKAMSTPTQKAGWLAPSSRYLGAQLFRALKPSPLSSKHRHDGKDGRTANQPGSVADALPQGCGLGNAFR